MSKRKTIPRQHHELYREAARTQYAKEGEIEIDDNAKISSGDPKAGAYVQAWVWIYRRDISDLAAEDAVCAAEARREAREDR